MRFEVLHVNTNGVVASKSFVFKKTKSSVLFRKSQEDFVNHVLFASVAWSVFTISYFFCLLLALPLSIAAPWVFRVLSSVLQRLSCFWRKLGLGLPIVKARWVSLVSLVPECLFCLWRRSHTGGGSVVLRLMR